MLGHIETVSDLIVALSAFEPEDRVVVSVFMKDHDVREAIASEFTVSPDAHGVSLEISVYDSDFCDAWDNKRKEDWLSAYEENTL